MLIVLGLCQRPANLAALSTFETHAHSGDSPRLWRVYRCATCGGVVTAAASKHEPSTVIQYFPQTQAVDESIPERARTFLAQAIESLHAPTGAVILCASSVDAMLKAKGLKTGTLNQRIDQAASTHLITAEMAAWAHEVRLDSNNQRHSDETAELPTEENAQKCIDFTKALGEFLFVLPARIARGRGGTD